MFRVLESWDRIEPSRVRLWRTMHHLHSTLFRKRMGLELRVGERKGCNRNEFHSLQYCLTSWYLGNVPPLSGVNCGTLAKPGSLDSPWWTGWFSSEPFQTSCPLTHPGAHDGCELSLRMDVLGPVELGPGLINDHWAFRFRAMSCVDRKSRSLT